MLSFKNRSQEIEIMDDLLCNGEVVHQTLRELETINTLLGGNSVTINGIKKLLTKKINRTISIIDLGCGGGDILKLISNWGKKNNYQFQLTGIDANPHIVAFAKNQSKEYPTIDFIPANIFSDSFSNFSFDIAVATLFTHHFTDVELVHLLKTLKQQAKIGIVINDLNRHWLAYYSIKILTQLFSKSSMVKYDAPLSVLRAFKKHELTSILSKAGITNYSLNWKWAFRWQLIITR
jgi:2-polyprenyl-3-methyl-5-hydroxy-6-metoxy-1,4-benzoquinol methylase